MKTRFAVCLVAIFAASIQAQVLPTNAVVYGRTMGEWSAEWWKWSFTAPFSQHPGTDTNGSRAHVNQPAGPVFFLAGAPKISTVVSRSFDVPEGQHLFLPLMTIETDNVNTVPELSVAELREQARGLIDLINELHASVDGVPVPDLFAYRAVSPAFSFFATSDDNLLSFFLDMPFTGLADPIVADGYYLMLAPLPPGTHVLNFGGAAGLPAPFSRDVTDTITVVRVPLPERVHSLISWVEASGLAQNRQRRLLLNLQRAERRFDIEHLRKGITQLRIFQSKARRALRKDPVLRDQLIQAAQLIIERAQECHP